MGTRINTIIITALMVLTSCTGVNTRNREHVDATTSEKDTVLDSNSGGQGLNGIRFANFTGKDWYDNEYIRHLRKYLDDYNSGKIKDEGLDPYKEIVRGKFVIGSAEPYLLGGLYITIVFVDYPENIFSSWVYSSVDDRTETILDYSVREISYEGKCRFTKEDIQQFLKENPTQKVW